MLYVNRENKMSIISPEGNVIKDKKIRIDKDICLHMNHMIISFYNSVHLSYFI